MNAIDNGGNNTVRGYTRQYMLRDGFFRLGMNDKSNVDRIKVIKGPSAAIYGQARPGGMIDVITRHPKRTDHVVASAEATIGSCKTDRVELSVNVPVPRLNDARLLVTPADCERNYDTPLTALRNRLA